MISPSNIQIQKTGAEAGIYAGDPCPLLIWSVRSILIGWVATKLDELPHQSKKYLASHHRKMNPHHEGMVRLDYHGAQQ
jgi:hypothetical protein